MEEMLYKFIDEGKREHEEMRAFIREFKKSNELLFKETNNSLSELRFEVHGLSRVIDNTLNCGVKRVTTRGEKMTTQDIRDDNTNIHTKEPPVVHHDKPVEPKEVLVENQPHMTKELMPTVLLNNAAIKEKDPGSDTNSVTLGTLMINNALADLGARDKSGDDSDLGTPIRPSANEIDEKKPELKDLPHHLEYAYLHGDKSFPIIIFSKLSEKEKILLLQVLEKRKGAIAWKMLDINGIRFFQIPIAPEDQEKTTFTFPYKRMPFGLCNVPTTFQRCMTAIFYDMVEDFMVVFMDDFLVFNNSFNCCLSNLDKMLARCEEINLVLNWEKCHFLVKEGIVLGHKISKAGFDIKIKDKKGAENLAANHLSRLENPDLGEFIEEEITNEFPDEHLMILKAELDDDEPWLCPGNAMRRCVAGKEILEILAHCHSRPTRGHHNASITRRKVYESEFFWPSIVKDAKEYVMRCNACQRSGNISSRSEMPQNNIQVCDVFDIWGLDFMGPFPNSRGNKYILVAVDYVSKWVEAQALLMNDARVMIKNLRGLFARFGVPNALISDRGTHFCNFQLEKALQKYGVTHTLSTTYHPQTNGQTEVTNRAIKRILERLVGYNPKNWSEKLDDELWAFRTANKTPTECTPFRLVYGKSCHLPIEIERKAY
ncbi:reverse transcriptase domain-containing protein [Tanacetum coccineum]